MKLDIAKLHFTKAPRIIVNPPGSNSKKMLLAQDKLESSSVKYAKEMPIAFDKGKGATLKDTNGNIYIDFFAGIGALNVGHSNPEVIKAAKEQMNKLVHTIEFPSVPRIRLMETLREIAPGSLKKHSKILFGGPTGTDAVAGALKLAQYNTKRKSIIAFQGSYHGQHGSGLAASANRKLKRDYLPLFPETHFMPYPYCYRCPFKKESTNCSLLCLEYLKDSLKDPYSGITKPAAIIVESVQGGGGVIVPPKDFLPGLRDLTEEHSIPLIIDEIQTGFGRTGKMFACELWNVEPDIMPMAKSIGGGFPLSANLFHKKLDTWSAGAHMGTFRGHAVAMAAGVAAIQFIRQNNLLDHVNILEKEWESRLKELEVEIEQVGEVRGRGLFIGIELVKSKKTKEPFQEMVKEVQTRCYQKGLLIWTAGHYGNVIRLLPPLTITETLFSKGLDILISVIKEVAKEY